MTGKPIAADEGGDPACWAHLFGDDHADGEQAEDREGGGEGDEGPDDPDGDA